MDSLHVCSSGQANSKTSSRSASPCRPPRHRDASDTQTGSVDSARSHEGVTVTPVSRSRQRSPTNRQRSPTHRPTPPSVVPMDETSAQKGAEHPDIETQTDNDDDVCFSSFLSNGSSEHVQYDDHDANATAKTILAIEHLNKKIIRVRESIKVEQNMRDDNVNEYLKLAANADKQQLQRIKAVFEKKNQKSAHVIAQLQKKLDSYSKRLRELESGGSAPGPHRPPREVLRDMGQGLKNVGGNIRDGITGFSGSVMSKPREFAHLIKNKFGSADNINHLSTWYIGGNTIQGGNHGNSSSSGQNGGQDGGNQNVGQDVHSTAHSSGNDGQTITTYTTTNQTVQSHHGSATLPSGSLAPQAKFPSDEGSECSSVTSESLPGYRNLEAGGQGVYSLKPIFAELQERREEYERLREKLDGYKTLQQEVQYLSSALQEERFRLERLEEQINDLTELHQNEVENLKQALADMEEKVQYQSEERLRDIQEMLETCQTKMLKMEHQSLQQQQYVTLEGLDNSNARALVVKLINVVLTVLQVVLLLVATVAGITMPFLRTRVRFLTTIFLIFAILFILRQWPEVRDIGGHVIHHLKDMLDPVK